MKRRWRDLKAIQKAIEKTRRELDEVAALLEDSGGFNPYDLVPLHWRRNDLITLLWQLEQAEDEIAARSWQTVSYESPMKITKS